MPGNQFRGSFELTQAKMLAKQGHNVTYLSCVFHPYKKIKKWGYVTWNEDDLTVCCYSAPYTWERLNFYCKRFVQKQWSKLLCNAHRQCGLPDVIHVHYPAMLAEPEVLEEYMHKGVKLAVTEHWSAVLINKLREHEKRRLCWYMQKADGVIAVSKSLAEAMERISGSRRKISVIPNMVSDAFKYKHGKQNDSVFRFITVGRLIPLRQYDKIITAFDDLFHGREDVTLSLVGDGSEFKRLKRLIESRKAEGNIYLCGAKPQEECAKLLSRSDCLVCYSRYETFGVPVIEAWACGIPVIMPEKLGFLDSSQSDKFGIATDCDDIETLKLALKKTAENKDGYDGEFISGYAREHFSEQVIGKKLNEFYQKCVY